MDSRASRLMRAVWKHSGLSDGYVFVPHISGIGTPGERFHAGEAIKVSGGKLPEIDTNTDWYWTPAVAFRDNRKKGSYNHQRVIWVDCDDGYDRKALLKLSPSIMWETSPGHCQAMWLMDEPVSPEEYSADGLVGLIASVTKADPSGVDIGQLLRVPGSWHHKREPYRGRILRATRTIHTVSDLVRRAGQALGLMADIAAYIATSEPYGDRSKQLWKFSSSLAEAGVSERDAFRLLRLTQWNKWRSDQEKLRADIHRAYSAGHTGSADTDTADPIDTATQPEPEDKTAEPWGMLSVSDIGGLAHQPAKWVIPGMIPEGGCGLLVASPKVGKTRAAIEGAIGCATGIRPFGRRIAKPTPVGFFSLEDGAHLFARRLDRAINGDAKRGKYHWSGSISSDFTWSPAKSMPLALSFDPIDLSLGEDRQRLYQTIKSHELGLVIIDTLSMAIGKHDINNSRDMYEILKDVKVIAKSTNCAVLFIHHTRKRVFDKGESIQEKVLGSTALHAWCDFLLSLASDDESALLRLASQTKMGSEALWLSQDLKIVDA